MRRETVKLDPYGLCEIDAMVNDWTSMALSISESLWTCHFDRFIVSPDNSYLLVYQNLGTKGLILRPDGSFVREIDRSYYHAGAYEYPAIFWKRTNGKTYIVHCPEKYNKIEIEEVETGNKIVSPKKRKRYPRGEYHSHFKIGSDGGTLLSRCGYLLQGGNFIEIFDLEECFLDPRKLAQSNLMPNFCIKIKGADFIDEDRVLLGYTFPSKKNTDVYAISVWNFRTNELFDPVMCGTKLGVHLHVIDENRAWDLYDYPKIIEIQTGKILDECPEIDSGQQDSPIIHHLKNLPKVAFERETGRIAIGFEDTLEILTP